MAPKSFLVTGLVVVMLVMAAPAAEAQLGGIIGPLLGWVQIQGIVPCSQNISAAVSGTLPPVFPNALVQLTCVGKIIATATTNAAGIFSMSVNPLEYLLSDILNSCHLVVPTPLSNCNPALPAIGVLQSGLQLVGNILMGLLNIANIMPAGFQFFKVA